jgi:16S rRNA (cytidine1402-2'-O)-methyltransferase
LTLFVVATPIGNAEDLSPRARSVLSAVHAVACEDTRRTGALFSKLGIRKSLIRYDQNVHRREAPRLLSRLRRGEDLALVTDAGTPGVSDPGPELVRAAAREGIAVSVIPGPSALTAVLAGSGFPADRFVFLGFPPRRPARVRREFAEAGTERTVVFLESPFRARKTLELALEVFGDVPAVVGRELTKTHEEWIRGTLSEVLSKLSGDGDRPLGEITVAIAPQLKNSEESESWRTPASQTKNL